MEKREQEGGREQERHIIKGGRLGRGGNTRHHSRSLTSPKAPATASNPPPARIETSTQLIRLHSAPPRPSHLSIPSSYPPNSFLDSSLLPSLPFLLIVFVSLISHNSFTIALLKVFLFPPHSPPFLLPSTFLFLLLLSPFFSSSPSLHLSLLSPCFSSSPFLHLSLHSRFPFPLRHLSPFLPFLRLLFPIRFPLPQPPPSLFPLSLSFPPNSFPLLSSSLPPSSSSLSIIDILFISFLLSFPLSLFPFLSSIVILFLSLFLLRFLQMFSVLHPFISLSPSLLFFSLSLSSSVFDSFLI